MRKTEVMLNTRAAGLGPYVCRGLHGQGLAVLKMPAAAPLGRACWSTPLDCGNNLPLPLLPLLPPAAPGDGVSTLTHITMVATDAQGAPPTSSSVLTSHHGLLAVSVPQVCSYPRAFASLSADQAPTLCLGAHWSPYFIAALPSTAYTPHPALIFLCSPISCTPIVLMFLLVPKRSSGCVVALMARTLCMLSICGMDTDLLYVVPSAMDALSCSPLGEPPSTSSS